MTQAYISRLKTLIEELVEEEATPLQSEFDLKSIQIWSKIKYLEGFISSL